MNLDDFLEHGIIDFLSAYEYPSEGMNIPTQLPPDLQHHSLTKILLKRDKTLFQKRQKKTHNTTSVCGRHGASIDVRILLATFHHSLP